MGPSNFLIDRSAVAHSGPGEPTMGQVKEGELGSNLPGCPLSVASGVSKLDIKPVDAETIEKH